MKFGKTDDFGSALIKRIANLDYEGCRKLLLDDCGKHENKLYPLFICICREKVTWRAIATKLGIDLEVEWKEDEFSQIIATKDKELCSIYMKKEGIVNGLKKVAVEGIFELFVLLFIEFGFVLDVADFTGHTALHHAIKFGFKSIAKLLIQSGASLEMKAPVASWIKARLPTLYHSLYFLDVEMTRLVLMHCDSEKHQFIVEDITQFVYLPKKLPETIEQCLQKLAEINPFNFLLIIMIIRSYGNPNITPQMLTEIINIGKDFKSLFLQLQLKHAVPEPLIDFHRNASASPKSSQNGFCKDRFFFQLIDSLYDVQCDIED